jgi:hypothetical protein
MKTMTTERVQELLEFSNSMSLYDLEFFINLNAERISVPMGFDEYVESHMGSQAHINGSTIDLLTYEFLDMIRKKRDESIDNEIGNLLNDEE